MAHSLDPRPALALALFLAGSAAFPLLAAPQAALGFSGNSLKVLEVVPEANTGLERIYVAYSLDGVSAYFDSASTVRFYKFSELGGGFAEEIAGVVREGDRWTLPELTPDTGYIVEADGRQHCFWIVDYSRHRLRINGIAPAPQQDCSASSLLVDGSGSPIHYYTVNGQRRTLSQEIRIAYNSLEWDAAQKTWRQTREETVLESLREEVSVVPAALCQTVFTISGDRFLSQWNWVQSAQTGLVQPVAVAAETEATQLGAELPEGQKSNVLKAGEGDGLGGSAPVEVEFLAWVTDAVVHSEWQLSRDPGFADPEVRFTQQDLDHTFTEEGTYYMRFIASNADGSCTFTTDPVAVNVGASELLVPNAFSPNGDGINDEWKVAYRSLLGFECWIFDRYGNEIKHFSNPSEGWDGKRGGKLVPPGVYYYVIQAKGADGREYKKSGDINILRSESTSGSQSPTAQ